MHDITPIVVSVERRGRTAATRALVAMGLVTALGAGVWLVALRPSGSSVDRHADLRLARQAATTLTGTSVRIANPEGIWIESIGTPPTAAGQKAVVSAAACDKTSAALDNRTATADTPMFKNVNTGGSVAGGIDVYQSVHHATAAMTALRSPTDGIRECLRQSFTLALQAAFSTATYQPVVTVDVQLHDTKTLANDGVVYVLEAKSTTASGAPVDVPVDILVARVDRGIVTLIMGNGGVLRYLPESELERTLMAGLFHELHPSDPPLAFTSGPSDPL